MKRKQSKDIRMESLLNAAMEEFLEKGYESATVDTIARKAGVSKGGLYHYFNNKEELLMAVNRKLTEPVFEMAEKACANSSALEGLKQYIREYLSHWAGHRKELKVFFLSLSKSFESQLLMEYYKEYINEYTAFVTDLFKKAMDAGEIDIDDPEAFSLSYIGTLDGVLSYSMVDPDMDIAVLSERVAKVLLKENGGR